MKFELTSNLVFQLNILISPKKAETNIFENAFVSKKSGKRTEHYLQSKYSPVVVKINFIFSTTTETQSAHVNGRFPVAAIAASRRGENPRKSAAI